MATTFDTEPEAQSVAAKLNAAARREPHVRYLRIKRHAKPYRGANR